MEIRGADSDGFLGTGGGGIARVLGVVSGSYDDGDTGIKKLKTKSLVSGAAVVYYPLSTYRFNGLVDAVRSRATQTERSNSGFARLLCFTCDPVEAGNTVVR